MIIKVCGMRNAENIQQLNQIQDVDWMGFIFTDKSKRYALAENNFDTKTNKKKVGVFVDASIDDILEKITKYQLDIIQLHGFESAKFVEKLKMSAGDLSPSKRVASDRIYIMKAFRVDSKFDFESTKTFEGLVDYFLFDAKGEAAGGNGIQFDWTVMNNYEGKTPFLLAGGINPDSFKDLVIFHHKLWVGIDINSGFEIEPANKNMRSIEEFTNRINSLKNPANVVRKFVKRFNRGDAVGLAELYHEDAINHQVANDPVIGKSAIERMFDQEFNQAEMVCLVENIFEDEKWGILEWKDPNGLRGCGFFKVIDGRIKFQRGYWDKLSFMKMHNIPIIEEQI